MKIRCFYNIRFLSKLGISAITLFPCILFADDKNSVSESLFRHELEHIYQVQRLGWIRFYSSYLKSYFSFRLKGLGHHVSYWSIPFEVEARESENQQLTAQEFELLGRNLS